VKVGKIAIFFQVTFHTMDVQNIASIFVAFKTQTFCQQVNRILMGGGVGGSQNSDEVVGGDGDGDSSSSGDVSHGDCDFPELASRANIT
jgi:hypothetical protein